MAIAYVMLFKGMKQEAYDAIMRHLGMLGGAGQWPDGAISHISGPIEQGWCVVDVWQSQAHFDDFFFKRLKPAFEQVGNVPKPQVTAFEVRLRYGHG